MTLVFIFDQSLFQFGIWQYWWMNVLVCFLYMCLWLLRRCRLNPDRNAFRKLNLWKYVIRKRHISRVLPSEGNRVWHRTYRLSFHFLSYFTVEIKRPIKYGWIIVHARFYARIPRFHTTFLLYPSVRSAVGPIFNILLTPTQILPNSRHGMRVVNHLVIEGSELTVWFQVTEIRGGA